MATVKQVLQHLIDGLRSLPPRRRRRDSSKAPCIVIRRSGHKETPPRPAAVTIRVATFNAAMFSMAPAVPPPAHGDDEDSSPHSPATPGRRPSKGILKPQCPPSPSKKLRVSINLQDGEITAGRSCRLLPNVNGGSWKGKAGRRSAAEVLREVGADVIALQNVRAEEERGMRPLSELAEGLGMRYAFAESWAPEYGNAVLSRWPIKRWKAHRVADHSDFRNVLRVTIDVPGAGEVNFHCTHLDHLDESWRMKQINSILRSADGHHILAGGLNALDGTDYSTERWADIAKYHEEMGKPTPKMEVMRHLKAKHYVDAKDFAGECEAVVVVAKGQGVQGTCKYGTRVDFILASPNSPYKFVPGSYAVVSSKGTSDHHIVKADVTMADTEGAGSALRRRKKRVVRMNKDSTKGIWAAR